MATFSGERGGEGGVVVCPNRLTLGALEAAAHGEDPRAVHKEEFVLTCVREIDAGFANGAVNRPDPLSPSVATSAYSRPAKWISPEDDAE